MANKNGIGFEGLRLEVFRPLEDAGREPGYQEFVGMPNVWSLVYLGDHVEVYAHDGFTPGGWLIAGGDITVVGNVYKDCAGVDLPSGSQLVKCADLPNVNVAAANQSMTVTEPTADQFQVAVKLSPAVGNALQLTANGLYVTPAVVVDVDAQNAGISVANPTTGIFQVGARLSSTAGNALQLIADGLYVAPAASTYVLKDCEGVDLPSGSNVATCDLIPTYALVAYTPGTNIDIEGTVTWGPLFDEFTIDFYNSSDVKLFTADLAEAINAANIRPATAVVSSDNIEVAFDGGHTYTPTVKINGVAAANALTSSVDGLLVTLPSTVVNSVTADYTANAPDFEDRDAQVFLCSGACDLVVIGAGAPKGTSITIVQADTTQVQIDPGAGAALVYPASFNNKTREQWSTITVMSINDTGTQYILMGDLEFAV